MGGVCYFSAKGWYGVGGSSFFRMIGLGDGSLGHKALTANKIGEKMYHLSMHLVLFGRPVWNKPPNRTEPRFGRPLSPLKILHFGTNPVCGQSFMSK
jgi:hypothetical protein